MFLNVCFSKNVKFKNIYQPWLKLHETLLETKMYQLIITFLCTSTVNGELVSCRILH